MTHQARCERCADLRSRAPESDPEDCPELVRLQDQDACRQMRAPGPVRPSPTLTGPRPDQKQPASSVLERMRQRRAELTNDQSPERPRAGRDQE